MPPAPPSPGTLAPRGRPAAFLLLRLALADLWHERMLTACVIVALTAVLAPLLILLSLKYGLVETLRTRLIEDPRNREVRPQTSQTFTLADIESLRARGDVSFVMPLLSSFSTNVRITTGADSQAVDAELIPTLEKDPMLAENGTRVPSLNQCALSHSLYHRLAGAEGNLQNVRLLITRRGAAGLEDAAVPLEVTGAVSERASAKETIFVQFQLLQEIENYLKGMPVPRLGWSGKVQGLSPVVEDIFFSLPRELDTVEEQTLTTSTAFSSLQKMAHQDYRLYVGAKVPQEHFCYRLGISGQRHEQPAGPEDIVRLRNTLPVTASALFGSCRQLDDVTISRLDGTPVRTTNMLVSAQEVSPAPKRLSTAEVAQKQPQAAAEPELVGPPAPALGSETVQKAVPVEVGPDGNPKPKTAVSATKAKDLPKPQIVVPASGAPVMPPAPPAGGAPQFRFDGPVVIPPRPVAPPVRKAPPPAKKSSKPAGEAKEESGSGKERRRSDKAPSTFIPPPPKGARYVMAALPKAALDEPALPAAEKTVPAMPEKARTVHLPASWGLKSGEIVFLSLETAGGPLRFSAVVSTHDGGQDTAALEQSLAGILRAAQDIPARFDAQLDAFLPSQDVWPSFRLVARDIDSVQALVDHFHSLGINVITKAERIRDVKELDRYTTHVFWLIAAVGLTGAVGALLASLIAAVERKRRSLGVMRLLGFRRWSLLRLPFYQSAIIVTASVALAVAAWHWVSGAIGTFTQRYLEAGESLQTLPHTYLAALWGGALVVAAIASLIAGVRVMSVDPSEAIRDE